MLKWLGVGGQPADVPSAFQNVANDTTGTQTETTFNNVLQELYEANGMPGGQLTLIAVLVLNAKSQTSLVRKAPQLH